EPSAKEPEADGTSAAPTAGAPAKYYYLVMEFVEGANLRQLERSRRLSPEEAFGIVPKICEALQFAHD
ncbi:MAG TPA: hypothetical protein DCY13_12120, partial [Verrucomicrobiales bacterium]|nr:hypothetical protein [Verrucomicrobiales bacterium]